MKKKLMAIMLAVAMISSCIPVQVFAEESNLYNGIESEDIEVNETTFPDELFRNYVISDILEGSKVLTEEDIEKVKVIDINMTDIHGIEDITGVKYFKYLEELYIKGQQLTFLPELPDSLRVLDAPCNKISKVPAFSENLVRLFLEHNCLEKIELNANAKYECINLYGNCIKDISCITGGGDISWDTGGEFIIGEQCCAHEWSKEHVVFDSPTCTEEGAEYIICIQCGEKKEETKQIVPATDHNWMWYVDQKPTCTATGSGLYRCSNCFEYKYETKENIPMVEHSWESDYRIDEQPNCTETGSKSIYCSECDTKKEGSEVVIPVRHFWNLIHVIDRAPTLYVPGVKSIHCELCDAIQEGSEIIIPAIGINWKEPVDDGTPGFRFSFNVAEDFMYNINEYASISELNVCQGMRFKIDYVDEEGWWTSDWLKSNGYLEYVPEVDEEDFYTDAHYRVNEMLNPGTYSIGEEYGEMQYRELFKMNVFSPAQLMFEMRYLNEEEQHWYTLDSRGIPTYQNQFSYKPGEKLQLNIYGKGFLGKKQVPVYLDTLAGGRWESSNPEVATVDALGCVTFTGTGSTKIRFTYEDNSIERIIYVYDDGVYMTKYNDVNRVTLGKSFDSDWALHFSGDGASNVAIMIFDDKTIAALEEKDLLGENTMHGFVPGKGYHTVWALKGTGGTAPLIFYYPELAGMTLTGYLVVPNNKCKHDYEEQQVMFESCDCYLSEDKLCDIQVTQPDGTVETMKRVPFKIEVLQDSILNNISIVEEIEAYYDKNGYISYAQEIYLEELFYQITHGYSPWSDEENLFSLPFMDYEDLVAIDKLLKSTLFSQIEFNLSENMEVDNLAFCSDLYAESPQKISISADENFEISNTTKEQIDINQQVISSYDIIITREIEENEEIEQITETPTELGITIDTGENLEDVDVTLIREHKDPKTGKVKAEVIDCETDGTKVKFKSDKFSQYTIVKSEKCEHEWDEGTVIKSATCINKGKMLYTCSKCDKTKNEDIPREKHTPSKAYTFYSIPDCTTGASLRLYCEYGCGYEFEDSRIETHPLGHNYKNKLTQATVTADGKLESKCTRCGDVEKTTKIYKASSMSLATSTYTYNGSTKTPTVTVKNSKGTVLKKDMDYSVKYASGRKNVGKYAVTVTLKGNYKGTIIKYFTINPKETSLSSLSKASKAFTAKWKKQSTQVTGYQIQYSTSKKFTSAKTVTVSSYKTTSKKITKLSKKKTYYVRIRTYKTVGKTKFYSGWSKVKSVKTK